MTTKKRRKRKPFWKDIKFKYRLTITNENTLEEVASLYVSKLNGLSVLLFTLLGLFLVAALIVSFTPLRNYLPGYMNSEIRRQVVENALRVDSLQRVLDRQAMYVMNIQDIFSGNIQTDTVQSMDSLTVLREDSLMERTQREATFRRQYEESEKYNLTNLAARTEADGLIFYRPAQGIVARPFDSEARHTGIDLAATAGESILATLDGTVLLSAYTAEAGYVLILQHTQDFTSVYKHCGSLLKQEGESVKGGEAIALMNQKAPAKGEEGAHLHFELWHRGRAVNPELYILF